MSELIRFTRSIPSAAEISPRRAASYSAASAWEWTSVGATSRARRATSISPAAIRSSVSQSTTTGSRRVSAATRREGDPTSRPDPTGGRPRRPGRRAQSVRVAAADLDGDPICTGLEDVLIAGWLRIDVEVRRCGFVSNGKSTCRRSIWRSEAGFTDYIVSGGLFWTRSVSGSALQEPRNPQRAASRSTSRPRRRLCPFRLGFPPASERAQRRILLPSRRRPDRSPQGRSEDRASAGAEG